MNSKPTKPMNKNSNEGMSTRSQITRRGFVKTTGLGITAAPFVASSGWGQTSPNERIGHAVIGTGGQGGGHCGRFARAKGCQLVAVCDVDPQRLNGKVKGLPNEERIKKYADFRKLLEDKSIPRGQPTGQSRQTT